MEKPQLAPDFAEFLRLLNGHEVEYLIVGGYAVAFHGYVRTTGDLDVWVRSTADNARRLLSAIEEFGFGGQGLTEKVLVQPNKLVRFGNPPVQIELFTSIKGPPFDECYGNRVVHDWAGIPVPFLGFDDLVAAKKASGRHIDLNDVERLGAG